MEIQKNIFQPLKTLEIPRIVEILFQALVLPFLYVSEHQNCRLHVEQNNFPVRDLIIPSLVREDRDHKAHTISDLTHWR